MTKRNRKIQSIGRVGAIALLLSLAASAATAMRPDGRPGDELRSRREARRVLEIRVMDIFAQNYGTTDWSLLTSDLVAHPDGNGNPAVMSIPLSLGNVYLNRYEVGHDKADLERAIQMFERVTSNRALWGGRDGSGSVVSYLDISLSRLEAECDIGGFESRIEELWQTAMAITAEEAGALLEEQPCGSTTWLGACVAAILPVADDPEAAASRASLLAAASTFLAEDPRAEAWAQAARQLVGRIPAGVCQTQETVLILSQGALSYRLVGREDPAEFASVLHGVSRTSSSCPQVRIDYETSGPVAFVAPGDSLDKAIRDSRVVAYHLSQVFLVLFPPGSQCAVVEDE